MALPRWSSAVLAEGRWLGPRSRSTKLLMELGLFHDVVHWRGRTRVTLLHGVVHWRRRTRIPLPRCLLGREGCLTFLRRRSCIGYPHWSLATPNPLVRWRSLVGTCGAAVVD